MITKWIDLKQATKDDVQRRCVHWKHDKTVSTFEEWAVKHAFHVTKAGTLDNRYNYAEPYYLATNHKELEG